VEQIRFVSGSLSVNKQDLEKNLKFFQEPKASVQSVYSKLAMRVFDVYANILKCLIHTLDTSRPDKYKRWRKESHEAKDK
jgi:hypothetical protein